MGKKNLFFFLTLFMLPYLIGCSSADMAEPEPLTERIAGDISGLEVAESGVPESEAVLAVMCPIRITAGDTILDGVLYDNETARGFAEMLPLTVELWHPAPNFARAFDLPKEIMTHETPGYQYELGSLAYWDAGPSIALIYEASRKETIVPVIPIGRITSDVAVFDEYGGVIMVELGEKIQWVPERKSIGKLL